MAADVPGIALEGEALRRAMLARLRFERAMGLETVAPIRFAPVRPAANDVPPARVAAPVPAPAAPSLPIKSQPPAAPVIATESVLFTEYEEPPPKPSTDAEKDARWAALEAKTKACTKCVLAKGRNNVVFGTGDRNAKLLFVGEGPGFDEDKQGLPFVGKAGMLLNKIITAMGLKREQVYICNVVKCRPPENRTPLPDEIGACSPYLFEQIELVGPAVMVALGAPAAKTLLNSKLGIMALRGRWHSYKGIPVMPTYHPAFVLRQYTEETRRAVWEDMKKVMEKLKLG